MPLTQDDLKFVLEVVPDIDGAKAAVDDVAAALESKRGSVSKAMGGIFHNTMSPAGEKAGAAIGGALGLGEGATSALKAVGGAIAGVIGTITTSVAVATEAVMEFVGAVNEFVSLANPAVVDQMNYALTDMQAVIGQALIPVTQNLTQFFRIIGDVLAEILPNFGEMKEAFRGFQEGFAELGNAIRNLMAHSGPPIRNFIAGLVSFIGGALGGAMQGLASVIEVVSEDLGPLIDLFSTLSSMVGEVLGVIGSAIKFVLVGTLKVLATVIHALLWPLQKLVELFKWLLHPIAQLFGVKDEKKGKRTSTGAAAREARFSGFDEYERSIQLSAFRMSASGPPQKSLYDHVAKIANWTDKTTPEAIADAIDGKRQTKAGDDSGANSKQRQAVRDVVRDTSYSGSGSDFGGDQGYSGSGGDFG